MSLVLVRPSGEVEGLWRKRETERQHAKRRKGGEGNRSNLKSHRKRRRKSSSLLEVDDIRDLEDEVALGSAVGRAGSLNAVSLHVFLC